MSSQKSAIVIGAGIVGLATARKLAIRGYDVTVIERTTRAVGASIRNFGMIWPVGQPDGGMYERAMTSRIIWKELCTRANIWHDEVGSLHLAYAHDEWQVLQELYEAYRHRGYELLPAEKIRSLSPSVVQTDLIGGLYSKDEMIVDPREAIRTIPIYLKEKYAVNFIWGKAATDVCYPVVYTGKETFEADEIYICSGADFETLYPDLFEKLELTRCKLQMMRLGQQPDGWRLGPALCGGLSLVHYQAFKAASSLTTLNKRFEEEYAEYLQWGIHVMVCQNQVGELTVGDSHEYGMVHDPFDKAFINELILAYLNKFAKFKDNRVIETWNGIYPKLTNGGTDIILKPQEGVTIINGLGGAGMTLSFGLCEEVC